MRIDVTVLKSKIHTPRTIPLRLEKCPFSLVVEHSLRTIETAKGRVFDPPKGQNGGGGGGGEEGGEKKEGGGTHTLFEYQQRRRGEERRGDRVRERPRDKEMAVTEAARQSLAVFSLPRLSQR